MRFESRSIGSAPAVAPTIVMLDGGGADWGALPEALVRSTGCGVCLCEWHDPDASGHRTTPAAARALAQTLDAIGFVRGILIGCGDGAAVATLYAGGTEDHRIRGLVLIAPHLDLEEERDLLDPIGYIRVPILIVAGTMDRGCPLPAIQAVQDEAYCPVDVARVEGAGRDPHLERPDDTLAIVARFASTLFTTFGEGRTRDHRRLEASDHVRHA